MKELSFHIRGIMLLIIFLVANTAVVGVAIAANSPIITLSTDKQYYYLRHKVTVHGNLTQNGSPVPDGLVALQVNNPSDDPIVFRTLSTGTALPEEETVRITDVTPCGAPQDYIPRNNFELGDALYVNVTGRNDDTSSHSVTLVVIAYDGNENPLAHTKTTIPVAAGHPFLWFTPEIYIPEWAYVGNATVYVNVYSNFPENGGYPYSPEASATFQITSSLGVLPTYPAGQETPQINGSYSTAFRISPEPEIGEYMVYASSKYGGWPVSRSASFEVESASYPPTPKFYWSPPETYVNMAVTFDASASTPDGGTILGYDWNFGDEEFGTGKTVIHAYTTVGTYTVTLNVTDSEGLWGAVSKPIEILPPSPPTAKFGWAPEKPYVDQTVTFDARNSEGGWSGTDWAPIVSYEWDFGDGNETTVGIPLITHVYTAEGNYTVSLNVTDNLGLSNSTSDTVEVTPQQGLGPWDINGDGVVDIMDVLIVGLAFGTQPGDPNWDIRADIAEEWELIDIMDILVVALHFGEVG